VVAGTGMELCSPARDVHHWVILLQRAFCRGTVFGKTILAQVLPWGGISLCKFGVDISTSVLSLLHRLLMTKQYFRAFFYNKHPVSPI
jgi:hypothetical protein